MELLQEQKQRSLPTEESSARLEAILDTAVDAIITTDHRGQIESFNRAAEEMFGCTAAEVTGSKLARLVPDCVVNGRPPEPARTKAPLILGRRSEMIGLRRDGSTFPIELALSGFEFNGRWIFTSIIRDVSRRWAAETELLEYREHLEELVADRTATLVNLQEALRGANANLKQLVRIDELTGIGNRRAFDERLAIEWRRQLRNGNPMSVLICDVDLFKYYNDHLGHPAGDACLRKIATAFNDCFQRAMEFAGRYGGEEFAAILANTDLAGARERAEILRKKVEELKIEHPALGPDAFVTVSVGVASVVPIRSLDSLSLVEAADAGLYRAKRNGRNCVKTANSVVNLDHRKSLSA